MTAITFRSTSFLEDPAVRVGTVARFAVSSRPLTEDVKRYTIVRVTICSRLSVKRSSLDGLSTGRGCWRVLRIIITPQQ
jgi:hypothetical protein